MLVLLLLYYLPWFLGIVRCRARVCCVHRECHIEKVMCCMGCIVSGDGCCCCFTIYLGFEGSFGAVQDGERIVHQQDAYTRPVH